MALIRGEIFVCLEYEIVFSVQRTWLGTLSTIIELIGNFKKKHNSTNVYLTVFPTH